MNKYFNDGWTKNDVRKYLSNERCYKTIEDANKEIKDERKGIIIDGV